MDGKHRFLRKGKGVKHKIEKMQKRVLREKTEKELAKKEKGKSPTR